MGERCGRPQETCWGDRMAGALDGLVVLDLTTHLSGPFCGMQLGDLGADVIKIESPQGDSMRGAPPFIEGEGAPFMLWNRNKRGIVLDLKAADDLEIFWDLVDGADVVLENFRPGVMDRLGHRLERAACAQSAAGAGLDLGLRPDRALRQARRLRSGDPGHVGPDVGDRPEGRPALSHPARHLRRRRRSLSHHRRAVGPAGAAQDRRGPVGRDLAARGHGVARRLRGGQLFRHRRAAGEAGAGPSRLLALPGVPDGRRLADHRRARSRISSARSAR